MKILILGGTVFLGRHLVQEALAAGHEVTLFNRGQNNPQLFEQLEKLRGDRDGALAALANRHWDAVIDTCGYVPRLVRDALAVLAGACRHYTFISSASVYEESWQLPLAEESKVKTTADETVEEVRGDTYGALKFLCERETQTKMKGNCLLLRPGLIVGPYDPSDRFTYWVRRVARGGDILAPGRKEATIQLIDARDLAAWTIAMIEKQETGVFNATGPAAELTMEDFLNTCLIACKSTAPGFARLVWLADKQLLENGIAPWSELPLWIPEGSKDRSLLSINSKKAQNKGLVYRPLAETIADTQSWDATRGENLEMKAGLKADKERELLAQCKTA